MPGWGWQASSVLDSHPEERDEVAELLGDCGASPVVLPTRLVLTPTLPHQPMSSWGPRRNSVT